ncbi:MAG: type II secretion system GspH family protein [Rectinema sp.]|nr:type II secretion system GspH family protein [Rectinema sp.]
MIRPCVPLFARPEARGPRQGQAAFTLIEVMVATLLCMLLAGVATTAYFQVDRAISKHKAIQTMYAEVAHMYARLMQIMSAVESYRKVSDDEWLFRARLTSPTDNTRCLGLDDTGQWAIWRLEATSAGIVLERAGGVWESDQQRAPINDELSSLSTNTGKELQMNRAPLLIPQLRVLILDQAKKQALYGNAGGPYENDRIRVESSNPYPVLRVWITVTNDPDATGDKGEDFFRERQGFIYRSFQFSIPLGDVQL